MQAKEGETKERQVALYLAGAVSQSSMSLSSKIKYWCACFPLWQRVREEYIYTSYEREAYDFLDSCLQLTNARQRSSWANLACAAVAPDTDMLILFNQGVICLLNDDCNQDNEIGQDERKGFKSLAKDILNREKFEDDEDKLATAAINKCLCRIDSKDDSYYYISIYHLLMYIAEWLDFGYDRLANPNNTAPTEDSQGLRKISKARYQSEWKRKLSQAKRQAFRAQIGAAGIMPVHVVLASRKTQSETRRSFPSNGIHIHINVIHPPICLIKCTAG